MTSASNQVNNTVIEELFGEFNENLRTTGQPDFSLLERCPEPHRKELRSLMNVAALAYRALRSERQGLLDDTASRLAS